VIARHGGVGDYPVERGHGLIHVLPLRVVVAVVDHIAFVADERDVLCGRVVGDPLRLVLGVRCPLFGVHLRVRQCDDRPVVRLLAGTGGGSQRGKADASTGGFEHPSSGRRGRPFEPVATVHTHTRDRSCGQSGHNPTTSLWSIRCLARHDGTVASAICRQFRHPIDTLLGSRTQTHPPDGD